MDTLPKGTVVAHFHDPEVPDTVSPTGYVMFTPVSLVKLPPEQAFVLPKPAKAVLTNGSISIDIVATDTESVPVGWYYKVTFHIEGTALRSGTLLVPQDTTVSLLDAILVDPIPPDTQSELLDRIIHLESGPTPVGMAFSANGVLNPMVGTNRFYNDTGSNAYIASIRGSVGVAPEGAAIIIDCNVDGQSIFTNQALRPTIPAGEVTAITYLSEYTFIWPVGSYLTIDIDQVGSTVAGSDLTVNVVFVG
jgi:hypothetical protein